jgi:hypothetical protein
LPASVGANVRVMAIAVNDATGVEVTASRTGISLMPPSPAGLRAVVNADHSVTLGWTRRSRLGWNWIDGGDVPLGEETERYQLRIASAAGLASVTTCVAPTFTLPADLREDELTIEVRQAGNHGLSLPATIIIPAEE